MPSASVLGLPTVIDVLVERSLEKDPQRRAKSVLSLMRHAAAELKTRAPSIRPPPAAAAQPRAIEPTTAGGRRGAAAALAGALALLAAVMVAAFLIASRGDLASAPAPQAPRAVRVLELTGEGVRVSAELGRSVRDLAEDPSAEARARVERNLELTAERVRSLRQRAEDRLGSSAPARARLDQAAVGAELAVAGLRRVATAPSAPGSALAMQGVRRGYESLLARLRETARGLSGSNQLRTEGRRNLDAIDVRLGAAAREAASALDRLDAEMEPSP
jgi:hypothetical protein